MNISLETGRRQLSFGRVRMSTTPP